MLGPDFRESAGEFLNHLQVGRLSEVRKWSIRQNKDDWLEILIRGMKWPGVSGSFVYLVSISVDDVVCLSRTDVEAEKAVRQAMAEALSSSEERYRIMFNNSSDPIFVHWATHDYFLGEPLEINDAACNLLGYARDELLIATTPIVLEEDLPRVATARHSLKEKTHLLFTVRFRSKQGDIIPMEVNSHYFILENQPVIISVARDIRCRDDLRDSVAHSFPETEQVEIWNKKDALWRVDGDLDLFADLVDVFFRSHTNTLEDMKKALAGHDSDTLIKLAHSFKGASGNLSATRLYQVAEQVEKYGRSGRLDDAGKTIHLLEYETTRFRDAMTRLGLFKNRESTE